jgi:hypothetical protein
MHNRDTESVVTLSYYSAAAIWVNRTVEKLRAEKLVRV